ncbi:MAG: hypothetical protein J0M17_08285 [Planctomycetes bacterium]|nr:hypothetical protein [Planctomycetota bacterium]
MDPQAAWNELLSASLNRDWGRAEELADGLLAWLGKHGAPPITVGDRALGVEWHNAVAQFVCYLAQSKVREARRRNRNRRRKS